MIAQVFAMLIVVATAAGGNRSLKQGGFGNFAFNDNVVDAQNSFLQESLQGDASSEDGTANSGNSLAFNDITDVNPENSFGAGFGQFAHDNTATVDTGSGPASSGNTILTNDITNSSVAADQLAEGNFAEADAGNANAGNTRNTGDITDSKVDVDSVALYNTAITDSGVANSGNLGFFDDVTGSNVNLDEVAIGNVAQSNSGFANAGNFDYFGNLSGRKLQKFDN